MPKSSYGQFILQLALLIIDLYVSCPLAVAAYPQFAKVKAADLEEEFRTLKRPDGSIIEEFQFNKGL